jgi:hypothetical protein
MLKLSSYPNLAIDSRRNSNNITQFVNAEVEHLTKARKLLPHSPAQTKIKKIIINKVIKDAARM